MVAQQVLCIQRAIELDLEYFDFEGTMLKLNSNCFVSITMNPGYAGRSELPDNLKVFNQSISILSGICGIQNKYTLLLLLLRIINYFIVHNLMALLSNYKMR